MYIFLRWEDSKGNGEVDKRNKWRGCQWTFTSCQSDDKFSQYQETWWSFLSVRTSLNLFDSFDKSVIIDVERERERRERRRGRGEIVIISVSMDRDLYNVTVRILRLNSDVTTSPSVMFTSQSLLEVSYIDIHISTSTHQICVLSLLFSYLFFPFFDLLPCGCVRTIKWMFCAQKILRNSKIIENHS